MALEGPSSGLLSMSLHGPPSGVLCKVAGSGLLSMSLQGTVSGLLCKGAVRLLSIPLQGTASELFCKGAVLSMPLQLPVVLSIALHGPAASSSSHAPPAHISVFRKRQPKQERRVSQRKT